VHFQIRCSIVSPSAFRQCSFNEAPNKFGLSDVAGGDVLRSPVNTAPLDLWLEGKIGAQTEPSVSLQRAATVAATGAPAIG
jgi:hypothetical protein